MRLESAMSGGIREARQSDRVAHGIEIIVETKRAAIRRVEVVTAINVTIGMHQIESNDGLLNAQSRRRRRRRPQGPGEIVEIVDDGPQHIAVTQLEEQSAQEPNPRGDLE